MRKKFIFTVIGIMMLSVFNVSNAYAQENKNWSMTIGAEATNKYLWRGLELSDAAIQPSVCFDYEKGDWALSIGAYGSKALEKDNYNEIEFSAEVSWKNFTFYAANYSEFYGSEFDKHYIDLGLGWTLSEKIPLRVEWYGIVNDGRFPSYLELSYGFSLAEIDFNAAVGAYPFKSDYYYNEDFCISNLNLSACHEFELNEKMALPVSAQIVYNPELKDFYWSMSTGFYFTLDF